MHGPSGSAAVFAAVGVFATAVIGAATAAAPSWSQDDAAACPAVERLYEACVAAGLQAYRQSSVGQGDFSYITKCGAERQAALAECQRPREAGAPPTPPADLLGNTSNQVTIEFMGAVNEEPRGCMTAEQAAQLTPWDWATGSYPPPCEGPGSELNGGGRTDRGDADDGAPLAACANATGRVHPETRFRRGPGACDGEVGLYLENELFQMVTCSYELRGLDGRWLTGLTDVPARGQDGRSGRVGGEADGLRRCAADGAYRLKCWVKPGPDSDAVCR